MGEHVVVDVISKDDAEHDDGEVVDHLEHLLGFEFAVGVAFGVALYRLTVGGIDAAVATPGGVAVDGDGEEADEEVVERWLDVAPDDADDGAEDAGEGCVEG